ncbi:MAG: ATP-binding cassette domain-containing protein [Syntrophomonadaceae bacterium]|nr:ATP-binding cassette domain-containing protein [Syntrophomonadaceae bacterium]
MLQLEGIGLTLENGTEGPREVLNNINLTLEDDRFYAITGPNGGGKTSLAKVIMGIYQPTSGRILHNGEDITGLGITERARRGIIYAFQHPPRFKGIRVRDLLQLANPGLSEQEIHVLLHDVGLCPEDYLDREVNASLSGGEVRRVEIATSLARQGNLMIFDEPEAGVDLWTFQQLVFMIIDMHERRKNTTMVITHSERFLNVADEIMLVAEGRVAERGSKEQIWPLIKDDIACRWRDRCGGDLRDPNCYR